MLHIWLSSITSCVDMGVEEFAMGIEEYVVEEYYLTMGSTSFVMGAGEG